MAQTIDNGGVVFPQQLPTPANEDPIEELAPEFLPPHTATEVVTKQLTSVNGGEGLPAQNLREFTYTGLGGSAVIESGPNNWHPAQVMNSFADVVHPNLFEVTVGGIGKFIEAANIKTPMGIGSDIIRAKARRISPFLPTATGTVINDTYINQPRGYFGDLTWAQHDLEIEFVMTEDMLLENVLWMLINGMDRINPNIPISGGTWIAKTQYTIDLQAALLAYSGRTPIRIVSYGGCFIKALEYTGIQNLTYGSAPTDAGRMKATFHFDYPTLLL